MKWFLIINFLFASLVPLGAQELPWTSLVTIRSSLADNRIKQGSGFFVTKNIIATAYHVIAGSSSIQIGNDGNVTSNDVYIIGYRADWDLALLKVNFDATPVRLSNRVPSTTERLFALGSPSGVFRSSYPVVASRPELIAASGLNATDGGPLLAGNLQTRVLPLAGIIYGGNSGGPVVDLAGDVLGVISGSERIGGAQGWAIPTSLLSSLLAQLKDSAGFKPSPNAPWEKIPFISRNLKTAENFQKPNYDIDTSLPELRQLSKTLDQLNAEIVTSNTAARNCNRIRFALNSSLSSYRNEPIAEFNESAQTLYANPVAFEQIRQFAGLLRTRRTIDGKIRSSFAILSKVPDNLSFDPDTRERIREDVKKLVDANKGLASTTYETNRNIDTEEVNQLLEFNWLSYAKFASIEEAEDYLKHLLNCENIMSKYSSSDFTQWRRRESKVYAEMLSLFEKWEKVTFFVPG